MANFKKSFNFRHGVQVDDDNFIVDSLGRVGIGSTIPSEIFDVGGNIKLRGTLYADVVETDSLISSNDTGTGSFSRINVGVVSVTSGIITATSGIVTYYGDGQYLQNIPTSQWVDIDVGLGFTSIYNTGYVGISTTDPRFTLQVGSSSTLTGNLISGVGISSAGNVTLTGILSTSNLYATGVVTSTKFIGIGSDLTGINAKNIAYETISADRFGDINTTGIITASSISAGTSITSADFYGNFIGTVTSAKDLTTDAEINITSIDSDYSNLGVSTVSSLYSSNSIIADNFVGIGTTSTTADLHVRKSGEAEIQITSDTDISRLVIGRSTTFNGNNFIIETNRTDPDVAFDEIGLNSVDLYNYAPGNFNFLLRPASSIHKKFNWINYSSNTVMMSLTQSGKLGIGITNPTETFEVVGTSTITSNAYIGGDFSVHGSITGNSISGTSLNLSGNLKTSGNIGVGLTDGDASPSRLFQVGFSQGGAGTETGSFIDQSGNAKFTGIVTSGHFSGIGSNLTQLKPENIVSGSLETSDFNINTSAGIITASKFVGIGSNLTQLKPENIVSGSLNTTNFSVNTSAGIITASKFVGIGSALTQLKPENIVDGFVDATNFSVNTSAGIITASKFVGIGSDLTQLNFSNISDTNIDTTNFNVNTSAGIITASKFVGTGSALTQLKAENIGLGTFASRMYFNSGIGIRTSSNTDYLRISNVEFTPDRGTFTATAGIATYIYRHDITGDTNITSLDCSVSISLNEKFSTEKMTIITNNDFSSTFTTHYGLVSNLSNNARIVTLGSAIEDIVDDPVDGNLKFIQVTVTPESGMSGLSTYRLFITSNLPVN